MTRSSLPYQIGHGETLIDPAERAAKYGHVGAVFWLHGLPSSGKSTLALRAEKSLFLAGKRVIAIDSAFVRLGICAGLSYSEPDRREYVSRIACMAAHCARFGQIVLVAAFTPFEEHRKLAHKIISSGHSASNQTRLLQKAPNSSLTDIFLDASVEICRARDPRGIWVKADRGELEPHFPIVNIPFTEPDVPSSQRLQMTGETSVDQSVSEFLAIINTKLGSYTISDKIANSD